MIGVRNAYFGFDSSHEWTIQLKKPYIQYLDRFNDGNWKREETSNILSFIKETYSDGCKQSEIRIDFNKKRNVAIISNGSFWCSFFFTTIITKPNHYEKVLNNFM